MTLQTRLSPSRARQRSDSGDWRELVHSLAETTNEADRERLFADFVAEYARTLPSAGRHWSSIVSLLRSAQLAEGITEQLAGAPRTVVDEIELPHFDDAEVLAESALRAGVRSRVYETELLTAAAVSRLLGSVSKNPRQLANRWRASGRLLGVPYRNQYLYPAFQVDAEHMRLRDAAAEVNVLLGAADDPWGVASWWLAPNGRIGGAAPADLLGDAGREPEIAELARSIAHDDVA